jgi:putative peptidoglycan lipid II flippase
MAVLEQQDPDRGKPAKKTVRLGRALSLVSSFTLLSRVFGFIRDMVIAHLFGAGLGVDAFIIAFKIPNFMRRLFAEGAFSQAFVPVLSEYRKTKSEAESKLFIDRMCSVLAAVLFLVTLFGVIAAPIVIIVFAPGFDFHGERFALASYMLRWTFPYLMLISLTAFMGAILNSYDRFSVPAFTPVLLNLCLIGAAFFVSPLFAHPVEALAIGVLLAGFVQLFFQLPFLMSLKLLPRPRWGWRDPGVMKVLRLMVPALLGVSVAQVNLMVDQWFASFLKIGSISWLYYSDRLTSLPLGVFGVAIATVILPSLSREHAGQSNQAYQATLDWALRLIVLIGTPAMLALLILSGPLLTTLFQYGQFSTYDVLMTRQSMMAFSLGVVATMSVKVLASGFYAKQNVALPVRIAIVCMVFNSLVALSLIVWLRHAGLALATSLSSMLNAALLFYYLRKQGALPSFRPWRRYAGQLLAANAVMGLGLYYLQGSLSLWFVHAALWRALHLFALILGASVVYFVVLFLFGLRLSFLRRG